MKKLYIGLFSLLLLAPTADAYMVKSLKCDGAAGGPAATSFQLWRKQPGETSYSIVADMPTCEFFNQEIVDTAGTCFKFSAKNEAGQKMREEVAICIDPTRIPPSAPNTIGVE